MDTLINVAHGFGVALLPINLLYCFIGVFIGTLVGVNLLLTGITRLMVGLTGRRLIRHATV